MVDLVEISAHWNKMLRYIRRIIIQIKVAAIYSSQEVKATIQNQKSTISEYIITTILIKKGISDNY